MNHVEARSRRALGRCLAALLLAPALGACAESAPPQPPPTRLPEPARAEPLARPNVLLILVDDLSARLGCLGGEPRAMTPNIDRLAARGVLFTNAHCAGPTCNPSRSALLSGMRPTTTGVYTNDDDWKDHIRAGLGLTVPFERAGYRVVGAGKVAHGSRHYGSEWDEYEDADEDDEHEHEHDGFLVPAPTDMADADLPDWGVVDFCARQFAKRERKPLFVACGLRRPHLPWAVPQKYFDLYGADLAPPPVVARDLDDVPPSGVRIAEPHERHRAVLKRGRWRAAVHGYLAACSYADAAVGHLLDALAASPRADDTIVVLLSDHGFHLGEKEHWRNGSLWDVGTRVPLIVVAPGVTPAGGRCDAPVELVSVFATLCELAGLAVPEHVEGKSLLPLLRDPRAPWPGGALTAFGYGNYAVATAQHRYIRYQDGGEELYDHATDPHEWRNLAGRRAALATKAELAAMLPVNAVRPGATPWGAEKGRKDDKSDGASKSEKKK